MNPGPAPEVALRLLPRPGARRRREVGVPSRLLRRVQRRARHAGRVLPRHHQDRVPGLRARQRHLESQGPAGAPAGHQDHRAADDRGRARRHLRRRPDARRARPLHRRAGRPALPLRRGRRRPLRHLLGPALAREGLPAGARFHRLAPGAAGREGQARARPVLGTSDSLPVVAKKRRARRWSAGTARPDAVAGACIALADALLDALPQTQCRRCGYADCRGLCAGDRRGRRASQSLPARRCRRGGPARPIRRSAGACARRRVRQRSTAFARADRRSRMHRLRALPEGLPDRRHRRRGQAHAHGHRRCLHRLRAVHSGLPGRLHLARRRERAGAAGRRTAAWSAWSRGAGRRGAPPRRTSACTAFRHRRELRSGHERRGDRALLRDAACRQSGAGSELEYASVFELLAAVLLSAQATDRGVNKATRALFAQAPTPQKMSRSACRRSRRRSRRSACIATRRRTCARPAAS